MHTAHNAHRPDLADRISPPSHTPAPITSHDTPTTVPIISAKAALMVIPRRELRGHKCLRSGTPINSYDFPQAMHPTSQHHHRRVTAASHCTTDNQPNTSTYPETKPGHADDRARCPDARTTVRRSLYAGTRHGRHGPGLHHRGPSNTARASRSYTL